MTECAVLVMESVLCLPPIPPGGSLGELERRSGVLSVASCSSADGGNGDPGTCPCTTSYSGSECAEGICKWWSDSLPTVRRLRPPARILLRSREGYGGGGSFGGLLSKMMADVVEGIKGDSAESAIAVQHGEMEVCKKYWGLLSRGGPGEISCSHGRLLSTWAHEREFSV